MDFDITHLFGHLRVPITRPVLQCFHNFRITIWSVCPFYTEICIIFYKSSKKRTKIRFAVYVFGLVLKLQ